VKRGSPRRGRCGPPDRNIARRAERRRATAAAVRPPRPARNVAVGGSSPRGGRSRPHGAGGRIIRPDSVAKRERRRRPARANGPRALLAHERAERTRDRRAIAPAIARGRGGEVKPVERRRPVAGRRPIERREGSAGRSSPSCGPIFRRRCDAGTRSRRSVRPNRPVVARAEAPVRSSAGEPERGRARGRATPAGLGTTARRARERGRSPRATPGRAVATVVAPCRAVDRGDRVIAPGGRTFPPSSAPCPSRLRTSCALGPARAVRRARLPAGVETGRMVGERVRPGPDGSACRHPRTSGEGARSGPLRPGIGRRTAVCGFRRGHRSRSAKAPAARSGGAAEGTPPDRGSSPAEITPRNPRPAFRARRSPADRGSARS
jgi:hypothetical protein